jgi:hypothetical protein
MKLPFRRKFWVVRRNYTLLPITYRVVKVRFSASTCDRFTDEIVDGPFDYQEDAARAKSFWERQDQLMGI